ncbi:RNA polymerase sigma factor SigM [Spongisporangium articulatum]|uniref:RNA polymerase sigma factor SigM n=1 Tax=Spongisporangium articulatum TaxID=3362603 RepID=A0ABW8AI11_9ACTN
MNPDAGDDDRQLLAAHLAGDPDAFTELVTRYRDRLWAVALRTTGDREEALDALQDAMVSALRAAGGFRGDSAVSTWLHRIVVNASLDRLRRRAVRPTVPLDDGRGGFERVADVPTRVDEAVATTARLDVRAALARLPEDQRVAIVLVDLEDLPVAEVAALLDVPEGTVKSRCARGRLAMARMLSDGGQDGSAASRPAPRRSGRRAAGNPTPPAGVPLQSDNREGR